MAKTKISEWSSTPANNTDIDSINIAEGCAPSGINDALREMMSQVKDLYSGTTGDVIAVAGGGTGVGTLTGIVKGNGTSAMTAVTAPSGTIVGTTDTQTLTNKTLTYPAIDNPQLGYTTTATAAGTTTLTVSSNHQQFFTGTTTQTIVLPVTSTLALGVGYSIENNSTGVLTVQSSGLNAITTIPAGVTTLFTCILTSGTTAASWDYDQVGFGTITGTGSAVLATSPTLVTPNLGVPSFATLTSATGLPLTTGVTGTLPTANGGTNLTSFTSGGVVYASSTSALATGSALTFSGSTLSVSASIAGATLASSGAYSLLSFTNSGGATKAGTILTNSSGILQSRAETLAWTNYDASSEYMRLTSTGLGIATSSPTAKLDVYAGSNGTGVRISNPTLGTAASPNYTELFFGSQNFSTGYASSIRSYNSGLDDYNSFLTFNTCSSNAAPIERMRITSAGLVGIGTSSPSTRLDVQAAEGRILLTSTTGTNASYFTASNTGGTFNIGRDSSAGGLSGTAYAATLFSTGAYPMVFGTNAAERLRIDNAGNVGIGVTSPSTYAALAVKDNGGNGTIAAISATNTLYIKNSGTSASITYNDPYPLTFGTNNTERLRIDSVGNLGLGVTPSAWASGTVGLQVRGTSLYSFTGANNFLSSNAYYNGTAWTYQATAAVAQYQMQGAQHTWFQAASGTAGNAITWTQAMTLTSAGDLLVGTTSALNTSKSTLAFNATTNNGFSINDTDGTAANVGYVYISRAGTTKGSITYANGTGLVSYNQTSDYRAKTVNGAIQNALSKVALLKPSTGRMNNAEQDVDFFVAHELQEVVPSAVTGEKDAVNEDSTPKYQMVDKSALIPLLTAAIQEQQALIVSLKARLDAANL
jgi:hypothetical protein